MRRIARWSRSLVSLVVLNAALVAAGVGAGSLAYALNGEPTPQGHTEVREPPGRTSSDHVSAILTGNLRVVGGLLSGACTLGVLTTLTLVWNAFGLGYGVAALANAVPGAIPLVLRYAPLEFAAFVLVASVAEHLVALVLRCLAANEPLRLRAATLTFVVALVLLVVGAVVEADVTRLVATPHPQHGGSHDIVDTVAAG
jgi:uncharacterized membrane protein SpoIIM required for sporulation